MAEDAIAAEPRPPVKPIHPLRPSRQGTRHRGRGRTGRQAPAGAAPDQAETLVDAITRSVLELLVPALHDSVAAAVRSLAPKMLISFPPSPAGKPAAEPVLPAQGVPRSRG